MYGIIQALSMVAAVVFGIFYGKKYGIGKGKSFLITLFNVVFGFMAVFILTWLETRKFGAQNAVRGYCFSALFVLAESKIFRVDFRKCLDFQSFFPSLSYGLGHFACLFPKCCYGFQYNEGSTMYNIAHALTGTNQLPMQLFEAFSALAVFAIVLIVSAKGKFKGTGRMMVLYQILFGAERFFWEFFRDNKKVIIFAPLKDAVSISSREAYFGISNLALWAAAIVIAGIILLIVLNAQDKKKAAKEIEAVAA